MNLSVTISGNTVAELAAGLQKALTSLCGTEGPPTAVDSGKKGPGRPPKAATEAAAVTAAPAAAPAASQVDDIFGEGPATPVPAKEYTFDQIKAALQEVANERTGDADKSAGLARVKAILEKLGVKMVKDIPKDKYAEVMTLVK